MKKKQHAAFTKIPNVVFDVAMSELSGSEYKVLFFVLRKTLGWNKSRDRIALSQFVQGTGLSKSAVVQAIKGLEAKGWLDANRSSGATNCYQFVNKINNGRDEWYHQYLASDEWKTKRNARLELDDHTCLMCGSTKRLHIHHATYERIGNESLNDLLTVCHVCHKKLHGREDA